MSDKMPCRITDEIVYNPWDHDDEDSTYQTESDEGEEE